jgi:hypothetical protein
MRGRAAIALVFAAVWGVALAHRAANSVVKLEFLAHSVRAEILVPESELAFATAAEQDSGSFATYLSRHLSVETPRGEAWKVEVRAARNTTYLDHAYLLAEVVMTPPEGASAQAFVLVDDVVTHEVRNHVVMVLARGAVDLEFLGALQYPQRRLTVQRPVTRAQNSH